MSSSPEASGSVESALGRPLARLGAVLWPASERLRLVRRGAAPAGFRAIRSYTAVPDLRRARFLLPDGARRGVAASVLRYNRLRPARMRAVRGVIGGMVRAGLGGVFRERLDVCIARDLTADDASEIVVEEWIEAHALGGHPALVAIGVGRQGPNRKPVLQLFSPRGEALGYAKIGWNDFTRELVRAEAQMLERCARAAPGPWTPAPLALGTCRDLEVSVVSPLPVDARRFDPTSPPPVELLRWIAGLDGRAEPGHLAGSPYAARMHAALETGDEPAAEAGRSLLGRLERADPALAFGTWHGDLVPWNLARVPDGLAVWDWEHAASGVPVGLDLVHWHFQTALILDGRDARDAVMAARAAVRGPLEALGVPARSHEAIVALYVVELLVRVERASRAGAGRSPRVWPALADIVRELAGSAPPPGQGSS
jgi:hypothetical protein